jgi:hypothetical protein
MVMVSGSVAGRISPLFSPVVAYFGHIWTH